MYDTLIKLFQEYLAGWTWEEWQAAGSSDREEIVVNALADLGPDLSIEVDEAYDLFYDWAAGLTPEDFGLTEALRIVSDPDILYHATEAVPLYKIYSSDVLKGSVNTHANINAVCLTTDEGYTIYGYPCKIQLSRQRLLDDGYEFIPFDEFEDDPDCAGESEERVYGDIENITKYTTAIYIDWDSIPIAQSADGDFVSGPVYDEDNSEDEEWSLAYSDLRKLLDDLKAKGIKVTEKGSPMYGEYYLDASGRLQYGELPRLG